MELREQIARIVCCLSDNPKECSYCRAHKGCPDEWSDVAARVDEILSLIRPEPPEEVRFQSTEFTDLSDEENRGSN